MADLTEAAARVKAGLADATRRLEAMDGPVPPLEGKLLRPLVAWASLAPERREAPPDAFWLGALAVQMVHEASLLHDDILDAASRRRGRPTVVAEEGVAAALVRGDRLLTASYRVAAATGSPAFLGLFVEAVERTVAGEEAQGRAAGSPVSAEAYRTMIRGKSGELFGCVTALPRALDVPDAPGDRELGRARELGRRLGALYQMVDDLLDWCPAADPGKPVLQDRAQGKWTWVAHEAALPSLEGPDRVLLRRVFGSPAGGDSPARRCLARLEAEAGEILEGRGGTSGVLDAVVEEWLEAARAGVARQESALLGDGVSAAPGAGAAQHVLEAALRRRASALPDREAWTACFDRNARSFRFASWLFPRDARDRIAALYAFCRFTDDLVDEAGSTPRDLVGPLVEAWRALARTAYEGTGTRIPLLDRVMADMEAAGVPFEYASALLDGVAMDAGRVRFSSVEELEVYTWRVASVVGGWMTRLFGVHDPSVLERAYDLGHAMQLTNILRDVGEDWRRDRLYLPADLMARHGVDESTVDGVARGARPIPPEWAALLEELMEVADHHYESAIRALPLLPPFARRPVAVAARVYQGIHDEIRRNGYDNGTRRAHTGPLRKLLLAARGLSDLVRVRIGAPGPLPAVPSPAVPGTDV